MLIRKKKSNRFIALTIAVIMLFVTCGNVYANSDKEQLVTPYYYIKNNQLIEYSENNDFDNALLASTSSYNNYTYEWVEFNRTTFSPSQVKELAKTIKRNQDNATVAAVILNLIPKVGNMAAALATIVVLGGDEVIKAAEKNQSMVIVQEKKVGYWDGYSPRTRHRYEFNWLIKEVSGEVMKKKYIFYILFSIVYIAISLFVYKATKDKIEPYKFLVIYLIISFPIKYMLDKKFIDF